ncbi:MAG: non-canonical purine NTP pyrophosphatase [Candidatus Moranbacteria bacterium]|nr:non-canonical purine NTP pyrophosphatase [Candidatus Moranbacteria bacterium]
MKILIGTNNENKLKQFKRIFVNFGSDTELFSLKDISITDDVEEDENSLLNNAKKKAQFYGEKSKMLTLADDTGLFVDALDGEPGIHAKRWYEGTEKERYLKILEKMRGIPEEKRTCRYTGVLAVYDPKDKTFWTFENNIEGAIANEPLEESGFGYDPIFISTHYDKCYSQMSDAERDAISHRGVGIKELIKHFD